MEKFSDQMCPPKPTSHSWKWAHAEGGKVYKIWPILHLLGGFPGGSDGKESACQCRRHKRCGFNPWVGKNRYKGNLLNTIKAIYKKPTANVINNVKKLQVFFSKIQNKARMSILISI